MHTTAFSTAQASLPVLPPGAVHQVAPTQANQGRRRTRGLRITPAGDVVLAAHQLSKVMVILDAAHPPPKKAEGEKVGAGEGAGVGAREFASQPASPLSDFADLQ